jgi:DNA-binding CsgD family transcriptional regulator
LRARNAFTLRRGSDAPPLFLTAAKQLEALDPAAARETYLEALDAALVVGGDGGTGVRIAAEAARSAPVAAGAPRPIDLLLDGMATRFTDGPEASVPVLKAAVQAFHDEVLDEPEATMQWLSRVQAVLPMAVFELWDDEALWSLPTRAVKLAREAGALTMLPIGLAYLGGAHLFGGDLVAASTAGEELNGIRAATGHVVVGAIGLYAWRAEEDALERINAAYAEATARGEGRVVSMAGCCAAILNNGLARYDAAIDGALRGSDEDDQWYVGWSLAELVEAATRGGRPDLVTPALRRLERRTRAAGTDWALGVLARSRALTLSGDEAEASYREAIERLQRTRTRTELFRAQLLYGEWLRREQRRRDAREHLRSAYDAFSAMGAAAFAERARRELVATGETVRKRSLDSGDALTPQEGQIARLAADGGSNAEIGRQLFISGRTVEYHLSKVFTKLGVKSRRELRTALR